MVYMHLLEIMIQVTAVVSAVFIAGIVANAVFGVAGIEPAPDSTMIENISIDSISSAVTVVIETVTAEIPFIIPILITFIGMGIVIFWRPHNHPRQVRNLQTTHQQSSRPPERLFEVHIVEPSNEEETTGGEIDYTDIGDVQFEEYDDN